MIKKIIFCSFLSISPIIASDNNTVVVFSHGIADTYRQAFLYVKQYVLNNIKQVNQRYLFDTPCITFNYPDATNARIRVKYWLTSFGQQNEIEPLYAAYQKAKAWKEDGTKEKKIILFGLSRGGSNVAILSGQKSLKHANALILESPFYVFSDVLQYHLKKLHLSWMPIQWAEKIAESIFKKYNRNGASPKKHIATISHDIPVLIICSKEDTTVPYTSSVRLYQELVKLGHKNVYILVTDFGKHAKILSDKDGEKYQHVTHAFCKKYNLAHDPSMAAIGESLLHDCQPDFSTISDI